MKELNNEKTGECPCGCDLKYTSCCKPIHEDHGLAQSAEALMRSRFSAFKYGLVDFLYETTHPTSRRFVNKKEIQNWVQENHWIGLQILRTTKNTIEFKAHFLDSQQLPNIQHERSTFKEYQGKWYYLSGILID